MNTFVRNDFPVQSPLTTLISAAARSGGRGAELFDVTVSVLARQTAELCALLHRAPTGPAVPSEIAALSVAFLDVLSGFAELRATRAARVRLCLLAEDFARTVSSWVDVVAVDQVTAQWSRVEQEILSGVRTCLAQ